MHRRGEERSEIRSNVIFAKRGDSHVGDGDCCRVNVALRLFATTIEPIYLARP